MEMSKIKRSLHPCSQGAGEGESPPRTSCPTTISQPDPRYPSFHTSVHQQSPWPWHAAHSPHTHTHTPRTHALLTRSHPTLGPPASSPICILPCSGFSFNMQVFPQGRGRGGYSGGDMMHRKRYGENKYFWSVNLTFFFLLKISLAYSILSV